MPVSVRAVFGDRQVPYAPAAFVRRDVGLRVPTSGNYAILLPDHKLAEFNYKPRQLNPEYGAKYAVPATRQFMQPPGHVTLPDAWARRWLEMIQWAANGLLSQRQLESVWWNLIRNRTAFTDNYSPQNNYRDPITGANPGRPNIGWATLGMIGNLLRLRGRQNGYQAIEVFDLRLPPPPLEEIIAQPWKWHWATEQSIVELPRDAEGGRQWVISNFWHLEDALGLVTGIPVPLVSLGGIQWVDFDHIERIDNGAAYSPYLPAL